MSGERELTFGERAVGLGLQSERRSGRSIELKTRSRRFHRQLRGINARQTDNPEVKRMYSVAITEAQTAQMWAVKAATWR